MDVISRYDIPLTEGGRGTVSVIRLRIEVCHWDHYVNIAVVLSLWCGVWRVPVRGETGGVNIVCC